MAFYKVTHCGTIVLVTRGVPYILEPNPLPTNLTPERIHWDCSILGRVRLGVSTLLLEETCDVSP